MSTYGLDDKKILKLDTGTPNTLTIFPDGVTNDTIVIEPDLPAGATTGKIIYRQTADGQLANVTVNPPLYFRNGDLSTYGHIGNVGTADVPRGINRPNIVPTNMTLARTQVGLNYITRNGRSLTCFLPGGDWTDDTSTNQLPGDCNRFQFLQIQANMSDLTPPAGAAQDVYVPCYYNIP